MVTSTAAPDDISRFSSHDALTAALAQVRSDEMTWDGPVAHALLTATQAILAPLARRTQSDPAEAMAVAWEFWLGCDFDKVANLWGYTVTSVARALRKEREAESKLTSVNGLRRAGAEHAIYSIHNLDRLEAVTAEAEVMDRSWSALAAVRQHMSAAGFSDEDSVWVLDTISDNISTSASLAAAADRLSRDRDLSRALNIRHQQWRALVTLIVGTTRGKPGLVVLIAEGHPNPSEVGYIKRAVTRLLASPEEMEGGS